MVKIFRMLISIDDFVLEDVSRDGIRDAGEPGLANVAVKLEDDPDVPFDGFRAADDTNEFKGLCAGDYRVTIELQPSRTITRHHPAMRAVTIHTTMIAVRLI